MTTQAQNRAAAVLVTGEIQNAQEAATFIMHGEPFTLLPIDAWQQSRLPLADCLDFDQWKAIAQVYVRIHAYNWRVQAGVLESSGQKERVLGDLLDAIASAEKALEALGLVADEAA